jgi:putative pyruvate formate lyase activating enzyme
MINITKTLPNYLEILDKKRKPKFQILKKKGELNRKISRSFKILKKCEFCEHKCKTNRYDKYLGQCKCPNKIWLSSYFNHYGEECFLVPSFTIFFMSCTFSCQFCQNWTISQRTEKGNFTDERELASIINKNIHSKNINFVGGEPTPYLPFILKTLKFVDIDQPIIWNSNFYMSKKSMNLLRNTIDIYLSDFKYGNNKCARRLSKINNYFDIITRNHIIAFKDSELVIRHLVLPNHIECCTKPIFDFISENFKDKVIINIMPQYHPEFKAFKYKEINKFLSSNEFNNVIKYAKELGLNFII